MINATHISLYVAVCIGVRARGAAASLSGAKPLFLGRSQHPKMKENFFSYLLKKKTEFVPSSEIKWPKSRIFTINYWVGWVFLGAVRKFFRAKMAQPPKKNLAHMPMVICNQYLLGWTGTSLLLLSCAAMPSGSMESGRAGAETIQWKNWLVKQSYLLNGRSHFWNAQ